MCIQEMLEAYLESRGQSLHELHAQTEAYEGRHAAMLHCGCELHTAQPSEASASASEDAKRNQVPMQGLSCSQHQRSCVLKPYCAVHGRAFREQFPCMVC